MSDRIDILEKTLAPFFAQVPRAKLRSLFATSRARHDESWLDVGKPALAIIRELCSAIETCHLYEVRARRRDRRSRVSLRDEPARLHREARAGEIRQKGRR